MTPEVRRRLVVLDALYEREMENVRTYVRTELEAYQKVEPGRIRDPELWAADRARELRDEIERQHVEDRGRVQAGMLPVPPRFEWAVVR